MLHAKLQIVMLLYDCIMSSNGSVTIPVKHEDATAWQLYMIRQDYCNVMLQ